ncbi:hypothetical protein ACFW04_014063 [Cataglyphis niger]
MYSAEGSSNSGKRFDEGNSKSVKRMNYYVPRDEIKPYKKPLDSCDKSRCISRILVRRFALTRTAYKYLDIGISGICVFCEILETFIKKCVDMERFLQSNIHISLRVEYLVMEHVKIHDACVVKLTVDDSCLYMKLAIILFLLELEYCVKYEYLKLYENTEDVNASFD